MNGIHALMEQAPEGLLAPSTVRAHGEKTAAMSRERGPYENMTTLVP